MAVVVAVVAAALAVEPKRRERRSNSVALS